MRSVPSQLRQNRHLARSSAAVGARASIPIVNVRTVLADQHGVAMPAFVQHRRKYPDRFVKAPTAPARYRRSRPRID
jgi:hypothetical protein